jgi:hypothetical protein
MAAPWKLTGGHFVFSRQKMLFALAWHLLRLERSRGMAQGDRDEVITRRRYDLDLVSTPLL